MNALGSPAERAGMEQMLTVTAVGSPATVQAKLNEIIAQTLADELIIAGAVHDHDARKRSYELLMGEFVADGLIVISAGYPDHVYRLFAQSQHAVR